MHATPQSYKGRPVLTGSVSGAWGKRAPPIACTVEEPRALRSGLFGRHRRHRLGRSAEKRVHDED